MRLLRIGLRPDIVKFDEINEAQHTARVSAQGTDAKGRGGAKASSQFWVEPTDSGSKLLVHSNLLLSGSVAQYGRGVGIIQAIAGRIISSSRKSEETRQGTRASQWPSGRQHQNLLRSLVPLSRSPPSPFFSSSGLQISSMGRPVPACAEGSNWANVAWPRGHFQREVKMLARLSCCDDRRRNCMDLNGDRDRVARPLQLGRQPSSETDSSEHLSQER